MSEYRISSYNVDKENGFINFNHYIRPMTYNHNIGFIYGEEREEFWFSLHIDKDKMKNFVFDSKDNIEYAKPICKGLDVQYFLRCVKGAKLISRNILMDYVYDEYGRCWENGFFTREVWDLSEVFA